jgi:hypothetical protein
MFLMESKTCSNSLFCRMFFRKTAHTFAKHALNLYFVACCDRKIVAGFAIPDQSESSAEAFSRIALAISPEF